MNSAFGDHADKPITKVANASTSAREDQISQAVRFFADPRTRSASLTEKEDFLRRKGLTEEEIRTAFSRYQSTQPSFDPMQQQPVYIRPAFMDEPILWSVVKSIFSAVGAMAIGVIGYHMYAKELASAASLSPVENSDKVSPDGVWKESSKLVCEGKFLEVMEDMAVKQELRHKEIMVSIRELSSRLSTVYTERKPGGSVVIPTSVVALPAHVEPSTSSSTPAVPDAKLDIMTDDFDLVAEIKSAIDAGIDTTLLLVLSSLDSSRKLNKTNPRFKKLAGNRILKHVGFKDEAEFLELPKSNFEDCRIRAQKVLIDLKAYRDEAKAQPDQPVVSDCPIAVESSSQPWLPASIVNPTMEPATYH